MAKIALADMIEELRNELQLAMEKGQGRSVRFELGEVTLEAEVAVEGAGKAGLKIVVLTGGTEFKKGTTHKVTLKLQPYDTSPGAEQKDAKTPRPKVHVTRRPAARKADG